MVQFWFGGVSLEDHGGVCKVWTCRWEQRSVDGCGPRQRGLWVLAAFHSIVLQLCSLQEEAPATLFFFFLPRVLLGVHLTHCGSFRIQPPRTPSLPRLLHRSSQKPSSFPAKRLMKRCQLHSWYYHPRLLPRQRYFPWAAVPNRLAYCVKVFVVTLWFVISCVLQWYYSV